MKFNKGLLVIALISMAGTCLADVNTLAANYGVQNNSIDQAGLNEALSILSLSDAKFNDNSTKAADIRAVSAVLRAQLSNNTTIDNIGNTDAFAKLFPFYTSDVVTQFKILLAGDTSAINRATAAKLIKISQWMGKQHAENGTITTGSIGNDINGAKRHDGAAALHYAAYSGSIDMIQDLLDLGADKSATLNYTEGPLAGITPEMFARGYRTNESERSSAADLLKA